MLVVAAVLRLKPLISVCETLDRVYVASMPPKKRTSSGEIKTNFDALNVASVGSEQSFKGKVMTKSGLMILGCTSTYFMLLAYQ